MTTTRELTPADGELLVRTTCEGAMAKMGHDLTLRVDDWHATLTLGESPAECALEVVAELASLRLVGSSGGAKPVGDGDREKIEQNASRSLGDGQLRFTSTAVGGTWDAGTVRGDLSLNQVTRPATLQVEQADGRYRLSGRVVQSEHRIKPFSTMMGALKVGDAVTFEVSVPA